MIVFLFLRKRRLGRVLEDDEGNFNRKVAKSKADRRLHDEMVRC
jgi:hypothetical protein